MCGNISSGWGLCRVLPVPLPTQSILGHPLGLSAPGHRRPRLDGPPGAVATSLSGIYGGEYYPSRYHFWPCFHQRASAFCQPSQIVRITVPDQTGVLINQSAVVDQQNDLVTFCVTSPANQTSTVLFDIKHVRLSDAHEICVTVPSDFHVLVFFFPLNMVVNVVLGQSLQLTNHLFVML